MTGPVPSVRDYVIDVAERAARTFAQTLAGLYGAGAVGLVHFGWAHALDIAGGAAVASILTSMIAAPVFGDNGTASFTPAVVSRSAVTKLRKQLAAVYGRHAEKPHVPRGAVDYAFAHGFVDHEAPITEPSGPWVIQKWPPVEGNVDTQEMPRVRYRLGRLPNAGRPRVKLTASMIPAAAYTPPPSVDWYSKVPASSWGMDGNDAVGDCTLAEVDHTTKARQVAAGNPEVKSSASEALAAYSAIAGYDPKQTRPDGSNPTDQGAEMQAVRDYWRKHGITLGGKLDKVTLFAEVDHTDLNLIKWCVDRFGAVALGINFPDSAMDQFNSGEPWTVVKGASIEGGHAISMIGYDADWAYVVTWGQVQKMAWGFFTKYVEEAWTDVSADWINAQSGQDPLGEVAYALGEQFAQVTGQPNPFPAPAPQPPVPVPPTPAPTGFPLAAVDPWLTHPYNFSHLERDAKSAIRAWLAGGGA